MYDNCIKRSLSPNHTNELDERAGIDDEMIFELAYDEVLLSYNFIFAFGHKSGLCDTQLVGSGQLYIELN